MVSRTDVKPNRREKKKKKKKKKSKNILLMTMERMQVGLNAAISTCVSIERCVSAHKRRPDR